MSILNELAKQDKRWRSVAFNICKDKDLADDIVQEMYINLAHYKEFNSRLVYKTMTNIFLLMLRNKKLERLDDVHNLSINQEAFEPNDYEQNILDKFDALEWIDQELIIESYDRSVRQIQEEYPLIHYGFAHRRITQAMQDIFGEDMDEQYVNKRNKRR
jgi:DNA-directed RNA polymerase specialized sigma24 family protein